MEVPSDTINEYINKGQAGSCRRREEDEPNRVRVEVIYRIQILIQVHVCRQGDVRVMS